MDGRNRTLLPSYVMKADVFMRVYRGTTTPTVAQIAAVAGCTERALCRMFQEYRGKEPMEALAAFQKERSE